MKKKIGALLFLLLIFLIWLQPINFGSTEVTIPKGTRAREIAEQLSHGHIVRDVNEFLFWLKLSGKEKFLRSGTYVLQKYKNPLYVIKELSRGTMSDIAVTIPEGHSIYETSEILAHHGIVDQKKFVALCNDENFIESIGLSVSSLEGYLFPDTYSFNTSQSDSEIIATFVRNAYRHFEKLALHNSDSIDIILTLASLVEKEAQVEDERPLIAKVFINRLVSRRPLESCATIFYALRQRDYERYRSKRQLTEQDLKLDSPYNTYLYYGLPPGPICSPGESSIKAVIEPADVKYLYFVSKGNGHHHFSQTFKEHIAAKQRYNVKK